MLGYRLLIELDTSLCEERQCAWLLSTYLKEGEEQKEVLEAKDDEEKESEVDGEVEERESLNLRMRHGDDREME